MNKQDLASRLAKQSHRSKGQAADAVETLVYRLLKDLKRPSEPAKSTASAPDSLSPRPRRDS